jgi:hypothetical protein
MLAPPTCSRTDRQIPCTLRWRATNYGRDAMGTSIDLRGHHFPNVHTGVVH